MKKERLVSCAIKRNGVVYAGPQSYAEIRNDLGDADCFYERLTDVHGYQTSTGRFVDWYAAAAIGYASGQCEKTNLALLPQSVWWHV